MIKNTKNCVNCKYDLFHWCFLVGCETCPNKTESLECRCNTIKFNKNCPYYDPFYPEVKNY